MLGTYTDEFTIRVKGRIFSLSPGETVTVMQVDRRHGKVKLSFKDGYSDWFHGSLVAKRLKLAS